MRCFKPFLVRSISLDVYFFSLFLVSFSAFIGEVSLPGEIFTFLMFLAVQDSSIGDLVTE